MRRIAAASGAMTSGASLTGLFYTLCQYKVFKGSSRGLDELPMLHTAQCYQADCVFAACAQAAAIPAFKRNETCRELHAAISSMLDSSSCFALKLSAFF